MTANANDFESASARRVEQDFTREQRLDCTVQREILRQRETASKSLVLWMGHESIRALRSGDPMAGYKKIATI
jgi:hypothetical protein